MKIAQVSITYKPILGGQEVYIDDLNKVITDAGWEYKVFQRNNGYTDSHIELVKVPHYLRPVMGFNLALIGQYFKLRSYDRLIVHYPDHYPTVAWHPGAIVLTHGVNWELDAEKKRQRRVKLAEYALKHAPSFVANDTHFYRTMGVNVAPATHYFKEVEKNRWFIPNCVDTNVFRRCPPHSKINWEKVLLVPRNITPARGVDIAVEAFAIARHKLPQGYKLVIVGDSLPNAESQAYKSQIIDRVSELGIQDDIKFIGSIPHSEMAAVYSASAATIIPTRANEGTALSALESMSCGTPTIVTAVAGLQDLPAMQSSTNSAELASHIVDLINSREKIAATQQKDVHQHFNQQLWAEAWRKVIIATNG